MTSKRGHLFRARLHDHSWIKTQFWAGALVMAGDSRSKGHGFESRHCILDGHFSHIFDVKNCNVCLKRPKINKKEAGLAHLKTHF